MNGLQPPLDSNDLALIELMSAPSLAGKHPRLAWDPTLVVLADLRRRENPDDPWATLPDDEPPDKKTKQTLYYNK